MTDTAPDLRSMPLADALRWLREHGEPADPRPDVDTESLRRRFPRLARVRMTDLKIQTPTGSQPVRVYRDDTATPTGRALVWVHGGAFIGGHLGMPESNWVALELAARGIPVLTADYTKCLGDVHFPVPSDDVLAAWRYAREHAAELFGSEPDALLLGGASAGGTLTAGVTARLRDAGEPLPAGLVLVYPVLHPGGALPEWVPGADDPHAQLSLNYVGSPEALTDPLAFPGLGSGHGYPPTLIVVCERDDRRPSGEAFADLLTRVGVDVSLRVEAGAGHGHLNEPADRTALPTIEAIAGWAGAR
ncbi:alpha/beta hydrolase [Humibacter ginsengisoli]